ncbi:hypothetical protein Tco_0893104 [Tanacetum coccineum]|uniref:Uncharacterized protein n=1 Tax=Tanacetum coccineum TaxID=301880 RepID=A0ABQ5C9H8_9ASTR
MMEMSKREVQLRVYQKQVVKTEKNRKTRLGVSSAGDALTRGKDGHHADQVHRGEGNSDNGGILSSSYASVLNDKISTPKVTIRSLHNNEVVQGTNLAIPLYSVYEIRNRFANTVYGYFIGKRLAFPIVENYVKMG